MSDHAPGKPTLWSELRRRNVLRAGVLYIGAVWALAQGIAQLSAPFGLPDWVTRWFVIACSIGFPFWVAFAWFYEFTPSGLKRESEIRPEDSITAHTGKKFDRWIIAVLALAVVLLATNTFVLRRDVNSTAQGADAKALAATLAKLPEKSVAVLPLANDSGDPGQLYFSDGLSEELISDLAQIDGLKVIGKYSSFKFRDSQDSPAQIGATLGVAHLIQGSVRQQAGNLRVMVSLIAAKDGAVVWSHTYDQQLKDLFAIQTHIGQAVAAALKVKLLGQALGMNDKPPSGDVKAYQLMLQGRALARHGNDTYYRQAIALYQQALKLDPDYAYAWGVLSNVWVNLGIQSQTSDARQQAFTQARVAADKQQALAPDAAHTHMTRGYLLAKVDNDPASALPEYQRAYALAPNDASVMYFLAGGLMDAGQLQPAVEMYRKAIAIDPLRTDFYANLGITLMVQGQLDAAERAIRQALALQPDYPGLYTNLVGINMARGQLDAAEQAAKTEATLHPAMLYVHGNLAQAHILRGDATAALRSAQQEHDPEWKAWAVAASMQIAPDRKKADAALHDFMARYGKDNPYDTAQLYGLRKQPDEMFEWLQRARTQGDRQLILGLLTGPFGLPYRHDPRFAALCKQLGLPLPGEVLPGAGASSSGVATPATTNAAVGKP